MPIDNTIFQSKRELWVEALLGDDRHSIRTQITQQMWYFAAFSIINEARAIAKPQDDGEVPLNGMMHDLIDHGFFVAQLVGIRRLVDGYPIEGAKGVVALTSLISDMLKNRSAITREAMFKAENLLLDYTSVKNAYDEFCKEQICAGRKQFGIPKALMWNRHELRHQQFDQICGLTSGERRISDTPHESVFSFLLLKLKQASRDVTTHVDKYIAHAATVESRAKINADDVGITLGHINDAMQSICQVASFLSKYFFGGAQLAPLPVPQFDHLKHLERPLVGRSQLTVLSKKWREIESEVRGWGAYTIDDCFQEMRNS